MTQIFKLSRHLRVQNGDQAPEGADLFFWFMCLKRYMCHKITYDGSCYQRHEQVLGSCRGLRDLLRVGVWLHAETSAGTQPARSREAPSRWPSSSARIGGACEGSRP